MCARARGRACGKQRFPLFSLGHRLLFSSHSVRACNIYLNLSILLSNFFFFLKKLVLRSRLYIFTTVVRSAATSTLRSFRKSRIPGDQEPSGRRRARNNEDSGNPVWQPVVGLGSGIRTYDNLPFAHFCTRRRCQIRMFDGRTLFPPCCSSFSVRTFSFLLVPPDNPPHVFSRAIVGCAVVGSGQEC